MGLLDNESIPRRKMTLFFVIDTSGSMIGSKIGSVNDAIENVLPMIGEISDENPDAEINVAALEFSTGTRWLYDEPKDAKEFIWQQVEADGLTSLGEACEELNKKLSRTGGSCLLQADALLLPSFFSLTVAQQTTSKVV